ncbi:LPD28 domain-containing protein [Bengtsoniella intestinalis]|uniref:LPD28 domain-containing protein n=1 Tax=Bengtsoniella intestinalis TaxID=3073143 RepID=UPI00391F08D1
MTQTEYSLLEFDKKPGLFVYERVPSIMVPQWLHAYELQGNCRDGCDPEVLKKSVRENFLGTVLLPWELQFPQGQEFLRVRGRLYFMSQTITMEAFASEHNIAMSENQRQFPLRPAGAEELSEFYSQSVDADAKSGCVGHLRMDFGASGMEFWHTWHAHNDDKLNTQTFKTELVDLVTELREHGPLKNRDGMRLFCMEQEGTPLSQGEPYVQGFVTESDQFRYCLRCNPTRGDYNAYLYIYDKYHQQLCQSQQAMSMTMGGM